MIVKQIRLKQDFYNTLNAIVNAKDMEEFGCKSTHISFVLKDLRSICSESEIDAFVDEAVQAIAHFANAN
ncbi:hypothetical protein [Veillonella sp. 3913]|uniref:hypothetical protein n=1 Tax=Veillonella sp. 3913 TaxID=2490952 RepID=UPI000F8E8B6C|nr:hypothetical protein [Veillonella sp. 3913]